MAATTRGSRAALAEQDRLASEERKPRPVVGWAVLGVIGLGIQAYTIGGWILSGDARPIDPGPSAVPTYMTVFARIFEVASVVAVVALLYFVVIRPRRREGQITQDGLLLLSFTVITWQDSCLNFFQTWMNYNSVYVNLAGWDRWVPGFLAPRGNLIVEPILFVPGFYIWGGFGAAVIGCRVLRMVKGRWPSLTTFHLIVVACLFGFLADFLVEPWFVLAGAWTYMGSIEWLTLFHGHYYQFPIHEAVFAGLWFAGITCLRYFRDDKGQTIVERGMAQVGGSTKRKAWIRWVAFVGAVNVITLVLYNIPMATLGVYADPVPADIQQRSYFMNGVCGPGTSYACPGPGVPLPRRDSAHLDVNGNLVVPEHQCRWAACPGTKPWQRVPEPNHDRR